MARPFADVLRELGAGATYEELALQLAEVVEAVIETRKPGELTIKLSIKPNGENSVLIADTVKTKVPEAVRGDSVFFVTSGGGLTRNDPRQPDLPLRRIEAAVPGEVA